MFRKPVEAITLCALFALFACLTLACSHGTGKAGQGSAVMTGEKESTAGPWLELKRRNWENNGTDTRIESDGSYTVTAIYMRTAREVRKGILPGVEVHELARQIENAQLFEMKDEYSAPFKSEWSWWGYILTVKTSRGTKSIRFHSEDDRVPENLRRIVESIMGMTK